MAADFGASVEGVRALLPQLTISETSEPSESDVERYIKAAAGHVSVRIGAPIPADVDSDEYAWAQGLVELGAAAYTQSAGFPERAAQAGDSYGEILWNRFLEGIDEFLEARGESTGSGDGVGRASPDLPTASFPPALFHRDQGF